MKIIILGSIMSTDTEVNKATLLENMEVYMTIGFPDGYDGNFTYQIYEDEVEGVRKSRHWDAMNMTDEYAIFTMYLDDGKKYVKVVAVDIDEEFNEKEDPKSFDSSLMDKADEIINKILRKNNYCDIDSREIYVEIDKIKGNEKLYAYLDIRAGIEVDAEIDYGFSAPFIMDDKICMCIVNYKAKGDKITTISI